MGFGENFIHLYSNSDGDDSTSTPQSTPPSTPPKKSNSCGDMSGPCTLPVVKGKHMDLLNISSETLAELITGKYQDVVSKFTVIDCRYPYEFEGGHIHCAINLYNERLVEEFYNSICGQEKDSITRDILIFHCEFSQQRGPTLLRYLRHLDRSRNIHNFPKLDYPEIYILDQGYEKFFQDFSRLCSPRGYIQMNDPRYDEELDKFWRKTKYTTKVKSSRRFVGNKHCRLLTF